ncbi:peptidoglycan-binding protein LysM [Ruegeria sp. ANG-S4]|uniref:LysM peptidoglycan-binding domain-containing protein n=1 Tax=Ruegeria sp. ANG-S4 TaxID=1577904 RepID=UPI00057FB121|nr:LysM peptidoglycan-binding domain-containing protein [Ruegeria sp. ANG-S4]KIC44010.1 peptidoglycan-binding protein LysM [Ruegeria sp. ANG-S4]
MNAKSGSGSSGTFIWGLVAGLVVLLGAGGLYLAGVFGSAPAPQEVEVQQPEETSPQTAEPAAPAEDAQAEAEPAITEEPEQSAQAPEPTQEESEETASATAAPVLDQIFVEPDGNAVLSGNAAPGSQVNVLLDGESVHSFTVDETGQFAEFVLIPFADDARGLVLETPGGDQPVRSDDYLIAALPKPAPEPGAPAVAEPEPSESDASTQEVAEAQPSTPTEEVAEAEGLAAPNDAGEDAEVSRADEPAAEAPETELAAVDENPGSGSATGPQPQTETEQGQQVAILRSGEEGVELVQPPAEDTPPDQVALDTIGYSDTGEVELTGRVKDESSVRLYLDNQLVADLDPVDDGQWRGEIEDVDPGVYTLRVDEVSPEGNVVSRIETPFKREPIETLRAAEGTTGPEAAPIRSVTVQKGDTLWAISRERFGDGVLYVRLFEANRESIRDPDLIYPGQIFTIPE